MHGNISWNINAHKLIYKSNMLTSKMTIKWAEKQKQYKSEVIGQTYNITEKGSAIDIEIFDEKYKKHCCAYYR